ARRRRTHRREDAATSLVLTACHRDRDLLRPALHFLAHQGTSVYIDFREGGFPDQFSTECADWLRDCLESDRRLVLVSTQEGLASPWTPWQLALAEGTLGLENLAVLPVEDYGYFRGSPLLGLYATIRRRRGAWSVVGPRGRVGPSLEDWLAC
ncbi:MAG TPA: hypothetical protein VLL48_01080, partial [Longimicrobiales bacterium]|nr:hypothetical protein [Longimicrobiales bacterium]